MLIKSDNRANVDIAIDERDRKDYFSPSTTLFADYCTAIASRYGLDRLGQILERDVRDIKYGCTTSVPELGRAFTVTTDEGRFHAKAVVLAIGPGNTKNIPWKLSKSESEGVCHTLDIRAFPSPNVKAKINSHQETNVVVVGGGLSSAHVVDMAIKAGVSRVWHFTRGYLKGKSCERAVDFEGADGFVPSKTF